MSNSIKTLYSTPTLEIFKLFLNQELEQILVQDHGIFRARERILEVVAGLLLSLVLILADGDLELETIIFVA